MPVYRYGLDPDEHGDYVGGIARVQVADPPPPPAGFNAPNPNASPIYALFMAGRFEVRVDGDADFDTRVGRPLLENGSLTKRELINKLDAITRIREYYHQNPDPDKGIGGLARKVEAVEVTEQVTGAVLDELEELRRYKREQEAREARPSPATEEVKVSTARAPLSEEQIISGLRPGETRCPVPGCGAWPKALYSHLRMSARNGKKLRTEHQKEFDAYNERLRLASA